MLCRFGVNEWNERMQEGRGRRRRLTGNDSGNVLAVVAADVLFRAENKGGLPVIQAVDVWYELGTPKEWILQLES